MSDSLNQQALLTYQDGGSKNIEIIVSNESVWITQKNLAEIFGVNVPAISKHISNIFEEGELDENSVVSILEITARAADIIVAITAQQGTFSCHKTTDIGDEGEVIETKNTQHCAGALILLEKIERPNQMMRWMERIGKYDRNRLDMNAPVFDNTSDFIEFHR